MTRLDNILGSMCKLDKQQQCARRKGVGVGSKRVPSPEPGEFPPHVLKQFEIDARAGVKRCPLCMQLTQFYVGSDQDGMYSECCHVTAAGCQVFSTQEETRTFATQDHGDANKNQARKRVELYTDEHDREMCLITDNPKAEMRLNQVLVWRQFVRNSPPGHVSLTDAQCKRLAILARAACLQWAKLDESKLDETKDEDVEALQAWEEFKGSPVFWFIVLVQQVIAESGSDFNVPTEELAHMLSMDAIHEYLSAFKSTRVHTAEKLGNATRAKGAAAQAAYLAADDKTRLARFDPLGDTDFKRINKIKFLDELLQGSGVMKKGLDRCGALHERILSAKPPRVVKDESLRHKPLWEKTVKLKPVVTGLQLANEVETRQRVLSNAASERVAEAKRIAELEKRAVAAMARVADYEAHKKVEAQTAAATEAEAEQDVATTSGEDSDDDDELSKMDLESEGAHEDYDADEDAMDPDDPLAAKVTIEKMGLTADEELAELEREERELERKLDPSYDSEEDEEHENEEEEEEEALAPLPRLEPVVVKTKDGEQTLVMEEDESDTDDEGEGEGATTACADKSARASGGAPQKRSAPRSGVASAAGPTVRSGRALDELISAGRYNEITAAEWATVGVRARPKTTKSISDHKLRRATNAEIKNAPDPVRAWIERAAKRAAHRQKSQDVQNRRKAKELAKEERKAIRKKTREQRLVDIQRLKEERRQARELLADQRCENRMKKIQPMRAGTVAVPIHADDIKPGTLPVKFKQFGAKHTFTAKKQKEIKEILNGERKITVNWVQCDTCRLWRMLPETHPGWPEDQFFFCQQINRTCGKRDPLDSEGKKEKKQKKK